MSSENLFCQFCGERIDDKKLNKAGAKGLQFCKKAHAVAARQAAGFYQKMGAAGAEAQRKYKQEHGHVPQYEKRKEAVAASNREKPRRKK